MRRYELRASQWRRIEGFLPGRPGSVGVTARDNRIFVNAVLWVLRSGAHWKDLPAEYGNWESVHKRFPLGQGWALGADLPGAAGRLGQQLRHD